MFTGGSKEPHREGLGTFAQRPPVTPPDSVHGVTARSLAQSDAGGRPQQGPPEPPPPPSPAAPTGQPGPCSAALFLLAPNGTSTAPPPGSTGPGRPTRPRHLGARFFLAK